MAFVCACVCMGGILVISAECSQLVVHIETKAVCMQRYQHLLHAKTIGSWSKCGK